MRSGFVKANAEKLAFRISIHADPEDHRTRDQEEAVRHPSGMAEIPGQRRTRNEKLKALLRARDYETEKPSSRNVPCPKPPVMSAMAAHRRRAHTV